jgi:CO dehydrogenase maturation factor
MIIGFFGKGGSGKTTTSTQFLRTIGPEYSDVLAMDADHNMDLSYNLGVEDPTLFVGTPKTTPGGIRLLTSGPHTEEVFRGEVCSHYLFRPLKEYLKTAPPTSEHLVVVDNTAGMDSVGAGIPACLDIAVVCVEPTLHSMKVGRQVVEGLRREDLPILIVANKIQNEKQEEDVRAAFSDLPVIRMPLYQIMNAHDPLPDEVVSAFQDLHTVAKHQRRSP